MERCVAGCHLIKSTVRRRGSFHPQGGKIKRGREGEQVNLALDIQRVKSRVVYSIPACAQDRNFETD